MASPSTAWVIEVAEIDSFEFGDKFDRVQPSDVLVAVAEEALEIIEWDFYLLEKKAREDAREFLPAAIKNRINHLLIDPDF